MSLTVEPGTAAHLQACLALDHLTVQGSGARRAEIVAAIEDGRLRVALQGGQPVGYAVDAPWFLGAPFLQLVVVAQEARGQGVGSRVVADFEARHTGRLFTSTNESNRPMVALLQRRGWSRCGELHGIDPGDPEIFHSLPR